MYADDKLIPQAQILKNITDYWDQINKSIVDVTQNLGQTNDSLKTTGSYSYVLNKNIASAAVRLEKMGVGTKVVSDFLNKMSENSGTMAGFASEAMIKYGALQKILGAANIDDTLENYSSLGKSLTDSTKSIEDMTMASYKMGLNATKVAKTLNTNFKSASNISFKKGSKEISEMARESVMLGVDMGEVLSKAKELRSPEQAIEFSQNMQMLGGDFANLFGDASNVLYNARNNTKQFQKDISKASSSLVTMNTETGELEVLPENFDKAALAASQLGMDVDTFLESGKKAKKLEIFKNMFGTLSDDQANVLTGFMSMKEGGKIALEGLEKMGLDTKELKEIGISQSELSDISGIQSEKMAALVERLKSSEQTTKGTVEEQVVATRQLSESIDDLKKMIQANATAINTLSKELNSSEGLRGTIQRKGGDKEGFLTAASETFAAGAQIIGQSITDNIEKFLDELSEQTSTRTRKKPRGTETNVEEESEESSGSEEECETCPDIGNTFKCVKKTINGKEKWCKKSRLGGIARRGIIVNRTKSMGGGGMFKGPSHEEGGIPVLNKSNGKMLEVEGGEAIINKKSTELFKPLLSKINETGGGVKFAEGGITPVDLENIMSKMSSIKNTPNISVGSNSPVNVNVNVNGTISVDGKNFTIPDDEKEKLSKNVIKQVMIKVNSEIGQSTIFTGGKKKSTDNTFDY